MRAYTVRGTVAMLALVKLEELVGGQHRVIRPRTKLANVPNAIQRQS